MTEEGARKQRKTLEIVLEELRDRLPRFPNPEQRAEVRKIERQIEELLKTEERLATPDMFGGVTSDRH